MKNQEYWVNVYQGIQPYQCHKWDSEIAAALGMSATSYDYPIYRIHVKMKPVYLKGVLNDDCERKFEIYS